MCMICLYSILKFWLGLYYSIDCYHFIQVLDGNSIASRELKKFCSSTVGVPAIYSSGSQLMVSYFQSGTQRMQNTNHKGFLAHYNTGG